MSNKSKHQHKAGSDLPSDDFNADAQYEHPPKRAAAQGNAHKKVGYGNPPKQHRFKKGQSGNPGGRPRNSLNRKTVLIRTLNDCVVAEAERFVSVQEGGVSIKMTVKNAVMRGIADRARKGDAVHTKMFLQMVSAVEQVKAERLEAIFDAVCVYKEHYEQEFKICDIRGIPRPEVFPHPDDIQLNLLTYEAEFAGPMCADEQKRMDGLIAERDRLIHLLENPDMDPEARGPEQLDILVMMLDDVLRINALLPPRLRRSYEGPLD